MSKSSGPFRVSLAVFGVLALIATVALSATTIRPTEATWSDRVMGTSQFGTSEIAGKNFARSAAAYGSLKPWLSGARSIGSVQREVAPPTHWIARNEVPSNWRNESAGNAITSVRASADTRTCARRENQQPDGCHLEDFPDGPGTSYAVSQIRDLEASALAILVRVPLVRTSSTPITATASCAPGVNGRASLSGSTVAIGGFLWNSGDQISIPSEGHQISFTRDIGLYTYKGVLQHRHIEKTGSALSQLRLFVEATGDVLGSEPWTFHVVLAHAECGASSSLTDAPPRPSTSWPSPLPEQNGQFSAMRTAEVLQAETPAAATSEVSPGNVDGTLLPSLEDVAGDESSTDEEGKSTETASSKTASPQPVQSSDSHAAEPETVDSAPTMPEPETSEPTVPTTVPAGPQDPEPVRVGREFAVVNREGVELGTAKIDDIVRTPGCGVELTLTIRTSAEAGPDRWASIGPGDFAEVRPGGSIRKAGRVSSDCEQATNSKTTALSAGREYEIVIAIALGDSAQRAMLRPDGTAGWVFDLPPLPKDAATTSQAPATTASPTPDAIEPSVETSVNTAEA